MVKQFFCDSATFGGIFALFPVLVYFSKLACLCHECFSKYRMLSQSRFLITLVTTRVSHESDQFIIFLFSTHSPEYELQTELHYSGV